MVSCGKKNKSERNQDFKADMQAIKKEDVRELQETFSQFFGKNSDEMRKRSSKLKNKIYLFGFVAIIFFVVVFYLKENLNFVGI